MGTTVFATWLSAGQSRIRATCLPLLPAAFRHGHCCPGLHAPVEWRPGPPLSGGRAQPASGGSACRPHPRLPGPAAEPAGDRRRGSWPGGGGRRSTGRPRAGPSELQRDSGEGGSGVGAPRGGGGRTGRRVPGPGSLDGRPGDPARVGGGPSRRGLHQRGGAARVPRADGRECLADPGLGPARRGKRIRTGVHRALWRTDCSGPACWYWQRVESACITPHQIE